MAISHNGTCFRVRHALVERFMARWELYLYELPISVELLIRFHLFQSHSIPFHLSTIQYFVKSIISLIYYSLITSSFNLLIFHYTRLTTSLFKQSFTINIISNRTFEASSTNLHITPNSEFTITSLFSRKTLERKMAHLHRRLYESCRYSRYESLSNSQKENKR